MKSHATKRFREALKGLPKNVKRQAVEAYKLFQQSPNHPSLRFKRVHPTKPGYSVRMSVDYRALGVRDGEEIVWFWVGSHADYDRLVSDR